MHNQAQSNADRYGDDQYGGVDGGRVGGQHRQVRLRNGDEGTQQEADGYDQPELAALGHAGAHVRADLRHGGIAAHGEQRHADNEHQRADEKRQHQVGFHGDKKQAQRCRDQCDGQHGRYGFLAFFKEKLFFSQCFSLSQDQYETLQFELHLIVRYYTIFFLTGTERNVTKIRRKYRRVCLVRAYARFVIRKKPCTFSGFML